jgi:hypothetical protein
MMGTSAGVAGLIRMVMGLPADTLQRPVIIACIVKSIDILWAPTRDLMFMHSRNYEQ